MTVKSPAPKRGVAKRARGWMRDRRGATAVEFAIIASPFVFMIFAIVQLALYFMVEVTLDNATSIAARQLRTGQTVADGSTDTAGKTAFLTSICSNMSWLQAQCQSGASPSGGTPYLVVDVRPLGSYSGAASAPAAVTGGALNNAKFCYYSGSAGSAVELRAFYRWQLISPVLMQSLQTLAGGVAELQSTEVFQIEPNGQTNSSSTQC